MRFELPRRWPYRVPSRDQVLIYRSQASTKASTFFIGQLRKAPDGAPYIQYLKTARDSGSADARGGFPLAFNVSPPEYVFLLGDIYAEKGLYSEAISEFLKLGDRPHALGHLGNAYARAGKVDAARKTISELEVHVRKDGLGRYEIALVYAGLGETDEAFQWLEKSYQAHDEGLTNLKIDPCLDPLRSDRRFEGLLRQVGLPL